MGIISKLGFNDHIPPQITVPDRNFRHTQIFIGALCLFLALGNYLRKFLFRQIVVKLQSIPG